MRRLAALAVFLLVVGAAGIVWATRGLPVAGALAGLGSALVALTSRVLRPGFRARPGSTGDEIVQAAEELARQVRTEWSGEARNRQLFDPEPLAVRWAASKGGTGGTVLAGAVTAGRADSIDSLVADFQRCGRRLAILGEPEAGKSDVAVLLALGLLASRQPAAVVPVIVSAATWEPHSETVEQWLSRRLAQDYPDLTRTSAYGSTAIRDLVATRSVLPVLDGLDELAPVARAQALRALNRAYGGTDPVVVTCRTSDYQQAVAASRALTNAAVIELEPARPAEALAFLTRGTTTGVQAARWRPVFGTIARNPTGHLASALSSPLMITLARDIFDAPGTDPAALISLPDQAAIESHLLGSLIHARFGDEAAIGAATSHHARRTDPESATRWLTFLAAHLDRQGTRDLAWWRLRRAVPTLSRRRWRGLLPALIAWPLTGACFGVATGVTAGTAEGVIVGAFLGFQVAMLVGSAYLFAGPGQPTGRTHPGGHASALDRLPSPVRVLAIAAAFALVSGLKYGISHGLAAGTEAGLINWLNVTLVVVLAKRSNLFNVMEEPSNFHWRRPERASRLLRRLSLAAVKGAFLGLLAGYGANFITNLPEANQPWLLGCLVGVINAGYALAASMREATESSEAASPLSTLRADRAAALFLPIPLVAAVTLFYAVAFGARSDGGALPYFWHAVYGLGFGMGLWISIAFTRAWPWYVAATAWFGLRGQLPFRLAGFLDEAHRQRILRQVGGVYQFRHARLQDHLCQRASTRQGSQATPRAPESAGASARR
jgi:hypothetical protein